MNFQLVVARYNENIEYLSYMKDIAIVYNKGNDDIPFHFETIKLPNIGRESHTYLYHIINNYDNLAETTMFMQGNIADHKMLKFIEYIKNEHQMTGHKTFHTIDILKSPIRFTGKYLKDLNSGHLKKSKYTPFEWINKIGMNINDLTSFEMIYGANFSVSKELILRRPIEFYKNIMKYVSYDNNPEEGHFFERSWFIIYIHPKFVERKIIYYYQTDNLSIETIEKFRDILRRDKDSNNKIKEIHLWTFNVKEFENTKKTDKKQHMLNCTYLNKNEYITIYPAIFNNSFSFKINDKGTLLLDFIFGCQYELRFDWESIEIFDCKNNEILNTFYLHRNISNVEFKISWNKNWFFINDFCKIPVMLYDTTEKISVKVRSDNAFIEYYNETDYNNGMNIFYSYKKGDELMRFYKDNYEDYYTIEI